MLKGIFPESSELKSLNTQEIIDSVIELYLKVKPFVANTQLYLNEAINNNKGVLLEGAQGALLDVDFGTYPYITSSNPTVGGACTGTGIPPTKIDNVIGIVKAYTTRVGEGPFPTELFDDEGKKMSAIGNEFGATTGRPRRCGWLDLVALKYACMINGVSELAITKSDVLDDFDEIKVCVKYDILGKQTDVFPANVYKLKRVTPVYKSFKGWKTKLNDVKEFENLNKNYKDYLKFIEDFVNVKVKYISTGPQRNEIIVRN
jgi:adenylosuccinate synthase